MISDTRTVADFQTFTFSGHSRTLAHKSLLQSIQLGHADYACYWTLELLSSGLVHSLWNTLFESAGLYVHRCPNMFTYLTSQYERFSEIENIFTIHTMTDIRNHEMARLLVCETAVALAVAKKQKPIGLPTIKPLHDFMPETVRENLRATTQTACLPFTKADDPYELKIPFNEFCFSVQTRDTLRALYWMSWILTYAREQKKRTKQSLIVAERRNPYVNSKFARALVWMFWDVVNAHTNTYVEALYKLYCLRWEPKLAKPRQALLLTAILFVTETPDAREPAKKNDLEISAVLHKIPQLLETIQATRNTFQARE
jgi:hypothetical protein